LAWRSNLSGLLKALSAAEPHSAPEFADIIYRSRVMQRAIAKAKYVAPRFVPVLLEGESGTGKELFARAPRPVLATLSCFPNVL
jgi:transcriptional regulator with PAS, ATPase and Fis domain